MSDQDYVYAVFRDTEKTVSVVESLNRAGMPSSQICVLGNKSEQFNQLAGRIDDPTGRYFIMFGLGGGIAGLLAGVSMALHIPGAYGFQIIVPPHGHHSRCLGFSVFLQFDRRLSRSKQASALGLRF